MSERWLPVPGWSDWYSVSDQGQVRAERRTIERTTGHPYTREARLLRPAVHGRSGHLRVRLSQQNRTRDVFVHVLVLEVFVGPCPPAHQGCHGDGDPTNNAVTNLRWDTQSANARDSVTHGTHTWARRTHCPQGHPYDTANTLRKARGRGCRACENNQQRAARAAQKASTP